MLHLHPTIRGMACANTLISLLVMEADNRRSDDLRRISFDSPALLVCVGSPVTSRTLARAMKYSRCSLTPDSYHTDHCGPHTVEL